MSAASDASELLSEMRGAVKWIWLNRPSVKNAITPDIADRIRAEIERAPADGARVVVLTGKDGAFCSGADLNAMAAMLGQDVSVEDIITQHYHALVLAMTRSPLPVIAAVDGAAAGIGCDIALAADLRLVTERAFFAEIFVNINLMPDGGGTYHLPRLVGLGRALEMALTGMRVSAEQAYDWGLANHVFPAENFAADVQQFAEQLAEKAPLSIARSKAAIRAHVGGATLEQALAHEAAGQQALCETADFGEGVMAFLERRKPNFTGR